MMPLEMVDCHKKQWYPKIFFLQQIKLEAQEVGLKWRAWLQYLHAIMP